MCSTGQIHVSHQQVVELANGGLTILCCGVRSIWAKVLEHLLDQLQLSQHHQAGCIITFNVDAEEVAKSTITCNLESSNFLHPRSDFLKLGFGRPNQNAAIGVQNAKMALLQAKTHSLTCNWCILASSDLAANGGSTCSAGFLLLPTHILLDVKCTVFG